MSTEHGKGRPPFCGTVLVLVAVGEAVEDVGGGGDGEEGGLEVGERRGRVWTGHFEWIWLSMSDHWCFLSCW